MRTLRQFRLAAALKSSTRTGSSRTSSLTWRHWASDSAGVDHAWLVRRRELQIRLYEAIGRLALKRFDRVYPVSSPQARELEARWGFDASRVRLLRNAVFVREIVQRPGDHVDPRRYLAGL
jgi:hypothetical protein